MVKVIAFCTTKKQAVLSPIAQRFAEHMKWYFGPTKLIDISVEEGSGKSFPIQNTGNRNSARRITPVSGYHDYLNEVLFNQAFVCGDRHWTDLRIHHHANRPRTKFPTGIARSNLKQNTYDFAVLDLDLGKSGFNAIKSAKIDEIVIVLEDTVSRYSEAYQFIKKAVQQSDVRRFNVLVNCGICRNLADDIFDRLDGLLSDINGLDYRFIGFVPSFKNDPKLKTLETLTLQNIAHELLDLKYGDKLHKIPKAMFEGALH